MANPAWTDLPTMFTLDQLREMAEKLPAHEQDGPLGMVETISEKPPGTEVLLSLSDDARVPYVYDGDDLLHRGDLRVADMQRKIGQRLAALQKEARK